MTDPVASSAAAPGAAAPVAASPDVAKLKKAAVQFEAVFLRQMIGAMRQASLGEGALDSGETEQFRDMSDSKLADQMANKGALHIADLLVKQYGARLGNGVKQAPAGAGGAAAGAGSTGTTAK